MSYIGNQSESKVSPARMREYVTGDGSATTFDLSHDIPGYGAENLIVVVNNVIQEPATAYTIKNDANGRPRRLDFGVALATTDTCYVIYQSTGQIYHTPPANSVGYSQLEANLRSGRVDQFAGSAGASSNTVFTLTETALNANSIMVYVNGIYQRPTTNYTVSGTALTFTASLADTDEVDVHHMSIRSTVSHVADGSVTSAKLDDNITIAGNLTAKENGKINAEGDFLSFGGKVDVSGINAGQINFNSNGEISLGGNLDASSTSNDGGNINIKSEYKIVQSYGSEINSLGNINGGNILLSAPNIMSSGSVSAKGNQQGGYIDLESEGYIRLLSSKIDVAGNTQGGLVRIGGEFQGNNNLTRTEEQQDVFVDRWGERRSLKNAKTVLVSDGSRIDISSSIGKAGTAIIWSDKETTIGNWSSENFYTIYDLSLIHI